MFINHWQKTGGWRLEAGSWRLETGGWRLETGDWRQEAETEVELAVDLVQKNGHGGQKLAAATGAAAALLICVLFLDTFKYRLNQPGFMPYYKDNNAAQNNGVPDQQAQTDTNNQHLGFGKYAIAATHPPVPGPPKRPTGSETVPHIIATSTVTTENTHPGCYNTAAVLPVSRNDPGRTFTWRPWRHPRPWGCPTVTPLQHRQTLDIMRPERSVKPLSMGTTSIDIPVAAVSLTSVPGGPMASNRPLVAGEWSRRKESDTTAVVAGTASMTSMAS
ncbi:hypothetical protein WMY93_009932 [Mugilogobius chulae]|uniref:Uncharacterized protein n=1 Tax=Mugilogobius chulae TaxID=88201 RepID=A0AAW0PIA3_9GOBI